MSAVAETTPQAGGPIGRRMRRKEDPRLITGRGSYVDDMVLPGMVYGEILRSPYAHARVAAIGSTIAGSTS